MYEITNFLQMVNSQQARRLFASYEREGSPTGSPDVLLVKLTAKESKYLSNGV